MNRYRSPRMGRLGIFVLAALLATVASPAPSDRAQAATAASVTIPVIVELSGSAAFLGRQEKLGLDLQQKVLDDRGANIKLVYYDDQSSPQVAVQLATQLIGSGARVLLGPGLRATCEAVLPLLAKGPLEFCLSPTLHAPPGSFAFAAGTDTWDLDRSVIRYARLRAWKRVAMLTSTDASGLDAQKGYHQILDEPENRDMTMVAESTFNPTDTSVNAQLVRINAAHPDMLLAWASGTPVGTILREVSQLGINVPVFTGFSNMTYTQMDSMAGFLPQRLYFPVPSAVGSQRPAAVTLNPRVETVLKDFEAAFAAAGVKPDGGDLVTWDPLLLLTQVLHDGGPDATSDQLRNRLSHMKGFAGINGSYDFEKYPQRGLGPDGALITEWDPTLKRWMVVSRSGGTPIDLGTN